MSLRDTVENLQKHVPELGHLPVLVVDTRSTLEPGNGIWVHKITFNGDDLEALLLIPDAPCREKAIAFEQMVRSLWQIAEEHPNANPFVSFPPLPYEDSEEADTFIAHFPIKSFCYLSEHNYFSVIIDIGDDEEEE